MTFINKLLMMGYNLVIGALVIIGLVLLFPNINRWFIYSPVGSVLLYAAYRTFFLKKNRIIK